MTIQDLVKKYQADRGNYLKATYNETQLRNDFIDPLLKCLGWDVDNEKGNSQFLRDVIQEEYIAIQEENTQKKPDYTLRINGTRKLFLEAKKPSVNILMSANAAFQTKRYGWNANISISVLTNFEDLIIYDCRFKPDQADNAQVALIKKFNFTEYVENCEEIRKLISFETANSGYLDDAFPTQHIKGQTFDFYFLTQIEKWREKLAHAAIRKNPTLNDEAINFLIQRLLNRIIFLRICEDRSIEKAETLKKIKNYDELKDLFKQSDQKFDSGLFNFIEDTLSLNIEIDSNILIEIFNELYYPLSPYDFSVVDPAILSQIYERFLGSKVVINGNKVTILAEPEVAISNGVVPTPKIIVEQIVKNTLTPLTERKSYAELSRLKIADICCGSGTFLISAFDFLLNKTLEQLIKEKEGNKDLISTTAGSFPTLTLKAKRNIIEQNLFGVDINPYAVEVTEFSLLLKLLEGENASTIQSFIHQYKQKALPNLSGNIKCGNAVVGPNFFQFMPEALTDHQLLYKIKPFDWEKEFPFLKLTKGFDAVIGNPPYVRIQKLVKYNREEIKYYQNSISGYSVVKKETFDKYYIFMQRAISLLNPDGLLGYIVPHKFFLLKGGMALRKYIATHSQLSKIIHFGVTQVFPGRSTYTAILIIQKTKQAVFQFKKINKVSPEVLAAENGFTDYATENFNTDPWIFLNPKTENVFKKIRRAGTTPLDKIADVCVGLQTSADDIYIFKPTQETNNTYIFKRNGISFEIEKSICLLAVYKLSINLFDTIKANAQMIYPYSIKNGKAILFEPAYFEENYPLAWAYLNAHYGEMSERKLQGKQPIWYQFGRSQSLSIFHNTTKLIWSVLATEPPYAFDNNNIQFTGGGNGPYYALIEKTKYSLFYIMGILSHPLFERMVKAGASEFRGVYYSHGKQFLDKLPIKIIDWDDAAAKDSHDTIVRIVQDLINSTATIQATFGQNKEVLERSKKLLSDMLIAYINKLYQISDEDYNIVMNDETFKELATEE